MVLSNNEQHENSLTNQKDGFYSKYGGLIIYGMMLAFLVALTIYHLPHILFLEGYIGEVFVSFLLILPIGISVALSIKTKGLDLSIPAMVVITTSILRSMDTPLLGFILALAVCIAIGTINAMVMHYSKVSGLLVTFITLMISSIIINLIPWNVLPWQDWKHVFEVSNLMPILLVIIVAIIALYIAVLSSKHSKKQFWTSIFPVYAGSGVFAVLYVLAYLFAGERAIVCWGDSYLFLLVAGVFFSITRFSKNKVLALALSLLPCLIYVITNSLFSFFINNFINFGVFILVMLVLVFYRGRAELVGQSHEKSFRARGWIALIPVILLLVKDIVLHYSNYITRGATMVSYMLNNITVDIMLVVIAVGMGVLYLLENKRNQTLVK